MRQSILVFLAGGLVACDEGPRPEATEPAEVFTAEPADDEEATARPVTVDEPVTEVREPPERIAAFDGGRSDVYWYDPRAERDRSDRTDRGLLQSSGTVHGSVSAIDPGNGWIEVSTGQGRLRMRGTPLDIASVNPGDVVSVPYADYRGELWVDTQGGLDPSSFAHSGTATGTVGWVDRRRGLLSIRGERFRAHPELVDDLVPGQFVQVRYYQVGRTIWVADIQPA